MKEINRLGEELHREAQAFWCELGWRAFWERILQEEIP